jgi:hypothetical protein
LSFLSYLVSPRPPHSAQKSARRTLMSHEGPWQLHSPKEGQTLALRVSALSSLPCLIHGHYFPLTSGTSPCMKCNKDLKAAFAEEHKLFAWPSRCLIGN